MPTPSSRPSARLWRGVVRASRLAAPALYVGTALLGATATSLTSLLLVGLLAGAAIGVTVALADPGFPGSAAARRRAVYAAGIGVLLLPFATGIGMLGTAGTLVVPLLLVLCAVTAAGWLAELDTSEAPPARQGVATPRETASREAGRRETGRRETAPRTDVPDLPRRPVDQLTTDQLFATWTATGEQLRRPVSPVTRVELADLRSALLDELLRREPETTARWLEQGAPAHGHHRDGGTPV
ncbi:hypothetical protein [Modestobacter roseus]|uniref:Uncharacterized protein n=1 Tax=Modestobacter roseus TaxID=1181884 RepID=A0A562IQU6_9ACTN|nr:hypothetical protein [Modestobacter roseus]MQA35598.1 hypothetical protein [Modestobacter roseus]TWH73083.1 hypothetical protein JD78_01606 [Modestobacter roseus]